jgi:hypothetical protein
MFVAGNMGVIVVWVMMPTSGRSVTVRWRQQAPLKFGTFLPDYMI